MSTDRQEIDPRAEPQPLQHLAAWGLVDPYEELWEGAIRRVGRKPVSMWRLTFGQGPDLRARTTSWTVEGKVLMEVVIEVFASSFLIASVISVQQEAGSSG